jgi:hypothetical protein
VIITRILTVIPFMMMLVCCVLTSLGEGNNDGFLRHDIVKKAGFYHSPSGNCEASLRIAEMGGFLCLDIRKKPYQGEEKDKKEICDITGMLWIANDILVYTVSPIYGKPGLFLYDCASHQIKQILRPKTKANAYRDGADFFELYGFSRDKIYFYYAPNVEAIDFSRFRTEEFLYQVNMDGSGFRKAAR